MSKKRFDYHIIYYKLIMDLSIFSTDKKQTVLNLYILNPKSKMFQTLKSAHFYSKIVIYFW